MIFLEGGPLDDVGTMSLPVFDPGPRRTMRWRVLLFLAVPALLLGFVLGAQVVLLESRQRGATGEDAGGPLPGALERLSGAVRIETVSRDDGPPDAEALERFARYLRGAFPRVHAELVHERLGGSHLLRWKGEDADRAPWLVLAHLDVVPADDAEAWEHAPFEGRVVDDVLHGRGTLDDKGSLLGWLEAIESLLEEGRRPRHDFVFAFGHDEEIGGDAGARVLAERLRADGERFACVLDEGGFVLQDGVPGLESPVALVGVAEKGYLTLGLTARGPGGHSSLPTPDGAVARLAEAVLRLESEPFPARLDGATAHHLDWLAPEASPAMRFALANRALFEGLILGRLLDDPQTAAMVRTTLAVTRLDAGTADNVLAREARATVQLRLLPGDTVAGVRARLEGILAGLDVELETVEADEPSPVSDPEHPAFRRLQRALARTHPDARVLPYLCVGGTDAKHYADLAEVVLRFLPLRLARADLARLHGTDERLSREDYRDLISCYRALLLDAGEN